MSPFSKYAAAAEHNTAIHRHTPITDLTKWHPLIVVPVSGDMLAVIKRGRDSRARQRRRLMQVVAR